MPTIRSPLVVAEAVVLVLLGLAALVLPLAAGLAVSVVIGGVLTLSGVVGLAVLLASGPHHHRGWSLLSAAIALAAGLLILINPFAATVGLTLLLGAYLLVDGVALVGLALNHRSRTTGQWGWLMASGVFDIVLAALVLMLGATGSAILVGVVVGVDLIAAGGALLMLRQVTTIIEPAAPSMT